MKNRVGLILATWFGAGYSPVAPGTAGSLAAIVIVFLLRHHAEPWHFAVLAALLFAPAVWAGGIAATVSGRKDPGRVVVDEVVGQWITIAGATTIDWKSC